MVQVCCLLGHIKHFNKALHTLAFTLQFMPDCGRTLLYLLRRCVSWQLLCLNFEVKTILSPCCLRSRDGHGGLLCGHGFRDHPALSIHVLKLRVLDKRLLRCKSLFWLDYFLVLLRQFALLESFKFLLDFYPCGFMVFASGIDLLLEQFRVSQLVLVVLSESVVPGGSLDKGLLRLRGRELLLVPRLLLPGCEGLGAA